MVGSSWPVPVLGSLYGPGGLAEGVFSSWVELHDGYFGAEHVAAFLSLTGVTLVRMAIKHACEPSLPTVQAGFKCEEHPTKQQLRQ